MSERLPPVNAHECSHVQRAGAVVLLTEGVARCQRT
jgi:hypothetical protein